MDSNNFIHRCSINWDVSSSQVEHKIFEHLSPCFMEHQYLPVDDTYMVMTTYCLIDAMNNSMPGCCSQYTRPIDVSFFV